MEDRRSGVCEEAQASLLANPALTWSFGQEGQQEAWRATGVVVARKSRDSVAPLFSTPSLGCLNMISCKKVGLRQPEGGLSLTPKTLVSETGEDGGSGARHLPFKGVGPQRGKMRKPEKLEYFQPPRRFPRRRRRDTRSPGSRGSSTELVAASRVTSGSFAKAEMTGHVFSIRLTWGGEPS